MEIYLVWYVPHNNDDLWQIMDVFTNLASAEAYVEKLRHLMPLHIEQVFAKTEFKD